MASRKMNVELKAKVRSLRPLKIRLLGMGGRRIGSFRQVDTYFAAPRGRLKIRETDRSKSQLVYYLRKNSRGPKISDVHLMPLPDPETMKAILSGVLGVRSVVRKEREIFRIRGVQVHLDRVDCLGNFIEFEKVVKAEALKISEARKQLGALLRELGVPKGNLQRASYGELLSRSGCH